MTYSEYPRDRYVPGTYKRECDVSGFDFLRSELSEQYDGLIVSEENFEERPRHLRKRRVRITRTIRIE